jgi:tagaturonate reductase
MRLNKKFIEENKYKIQNITIGPLKQMPERVIQFGEGNFLRAFVDWQFNELNKKNLFNGKVVIVQPLKNGMTDILNEQDGLYTLLLRGIKNGNEIEKTELITSISRCLNPYSQWKEFLQCAANPLLRFVVSNTTEAGISYQKTDLPLDECPDSFPAKVTYFLFERFKLFDGDPEKGMIIIPCELIENNGDNLKSCILQHANDWMLGKDFINWLNSSNYFFNTLVDRIVPGYPRDEINELTYKIGYEDKAIVAAELFHLWVIQGNEKVKHELPFKDAGLNVVWTDDITPYRTLKVRTLNGAHTMFTIPAYLSGLKTVRESVQDEILGEMIKNGIFYEILPTLNFPESEKLEFANEVLERFKNPFIKHYLKSIILNSVSKFKVRVLPTIIEYYEKNGELPAILTFSLAALIVFYIRYNGINKMKEHINDSEEFQAQDDEDVLQFFNSLNDEFPNSPFNIVEETLKNEKLWGADLSKIDNLVYCITEHYESITQIGMKAAIEELTDSQLKNYKKKI